MKKYLLICLLLAFTACSNSGAVNRNAAPEPEAQVSPQNNGQCEQCIAANCYAGGCNLQCKHYGSWCETIVMGDYSPETIAANEVAFFIVQRVEKLNSKLRAAGVQVGDTITHVNDQFAGENDAVKLRFSDLVLTMPKGMRLRIIRADNSRAEVTL